MDIALLAEEISSTFRMHNEDGSSIPLRNHYAVSQFAGTKSVHNLVPLIILFTKHDGDPIEGDKTRRTKTGEMQNTWTHINSVGKSGRKRPLRI